MSFLRKWRLEFLVASRNNDALVAALGDPRYLCSNGMTVRIINALGRFGDRRAVDPMIDVLHEDRGATVRSTAAIALGRLGDTKAIPILRALLDDSDRPTRLWAMQSSRALEPVRRAHEESRGFTKRRIGRALGELETRFG